MAKMVLRKKNRETGETDFCGWGGENWFLLGDDVSSNYLNLKRKLSIH